MRHPVDIGEPIASGRRDLVAIERKALIGALFAAGVFTLVVLVNGVLAILLIGLLQVAGLWAVDPEATENAVSELSRRFRAAPFATGA